MEMETALETNIKIVPFIIVIILAIWHLAIKVPVHRLVEASDSIITITTKRILLLIIVIVLSITKATAKIKMYQGASWRNLLAPKLILEAIRIY